MPTLAVQLASGQEVVSDFFLGCRQQNRANLADAAGCQNLQSLPLGVLCCRLRASAWRTP